MKKLNGPIANERNLDTGLKHYERVNEFTGEIIPVLPEYSTMSTRPSIGTNWIARYTTDVYPKDYTTINGMRCKPPRSYDRYLESIDIDMYDDIKAGRQLQGYNSDDNTDARLSARETVKRAQFKQLKRSL